MKQFFLIAYDAKDAGASERRMASRTAHLEAIAQYRDKGHLLLGAAITDDAGKMIGSLIAANFPSRKEFDEWLATDPYTVNKVWENITVLNCSVAPTFQHLLKENAL